LEIQQTRLFKIIIIYLKGNKSRQWCMEPPNIYSEKIISKK